MWYLRYGKLVLQCGSKKFIENLLTTTYKDCRKYYNIASEQQIKEESWEF